MPAGLFGRVSGKTTNSNASAQNGSTGRNGNSSGGAPNGAIRLRGAIGKYNGANTTEYDSITPRSGFWGQFKYDEDYGAPTWTSGQTHPTHTFTVNSGIASTFTSYTPMEYGNVRTSHYDATRQNVKLSDFYRGVTKTHTFSGGSHNYQRVPDTMGNYVTIPTSGEIRMSAFRDQAQAPAKDQLKTAYSQLAGPEGPGSSNNGNNRYSATQGANIIANTIFSTNINVTNEQGADNGVEYAGYNNYSYFANTYGPQGGTINVAGYGRYPGPQHFQANYSGVDNSTVANYHTSGSRYNTSISLDMWFSPKIGWGADDYNYMTPQTYSFLGGGSLGSGGSYPYGASHYQLRDENIWRPFLQTEWTTIYIQHTSATGYPTTPISNFTVYAYDPYKDFTQITGSQTWAYSNGNSIGSQTYTPTLLQNYDRFKSYYIQVPTNIANIHRIMGTFYKNSGNIISLRTLAFLPGKFTFRVDKTGDTNGGTQLSSSYGSTGTYSDNGYGFVLAATGATRSPDSSMWQSLHIDGRNSSGTQFSTDVYRRLLLNADYWYDGAAHEIGILRTSGTGYTSANAQAEVGTAGRGASARGPYIDIGVPDEYQD